MKYCRPAALLFAIALVGCDSDEPPGPVDPGGGLSRPENTDEACRNGVDDDNNGSIDCEDLTCLQTPTVTVCRLDSENTDALCHDNQDNDNDGLADCADPDCEFFGCYENSDATCDDGIDNDGDRFADCEDFDCLYGCGITICDDGPTERSEADCSDGEDNDGDGHVDCADYGCRDCVASCQGGLGENTPSLCADGEDNDGDGGIDCQDTECFRLDGLEGCDTGEESTPALCNDGIDNDNDPFIDCADGSCAGIGNCHEDTASACTDGVDNDGDNYVDCQDRDCSGVAGCGESTDFLCSDGLDNNSNNFVDCEDFDCKFGCAVTVCDGVEKSAADCSDGVDNDADGFTDCDDRGCEDCAASCGANTDPPDGQQVGENTLELCTDGQDNDGDNLADCRDLECFYLEGMTGCDTTETNCGDGIDNDNDPWIDCDDRDCRGEADCVETGAAACSDGADNDADGFTDCDDYDCRDEASVCDPAPSEGDDITCADGIDNDNDDVVDCDDYDCAGNPALTVCPAPTIFSIASLQDASADDHPELTEEAPQLRVRLKSVTVTTPLLENRSGRYGFFVQESFPVEGNAESRDTRHSAIYVYANRDQPQVAPGQVIDLLGFYMRHFDAAQVRYGSHNVVEASVPVIPTPLETNALADGLASGYHGVLVQLGAVRVTEVDVASVGGEDPEFDDFAVLEASAPASLPSLVVTTEYTEQSVAVDDRFGGIVGVMHHSWGVLRLAPRGADDYLGESVDSTDSDGDGLTDSVESLIGTDPSSRDTDGDNEEDLAEVVDSLQPKDSDCDGKIDALESSGLDADMDGDVDEVDYDDQDGDNGDPDGDDKPNSADINDDGDDYCDPGIGAAVAGDCGQLEDNCPTKANDDQSNLDDDHFGDACDPDIDGDGICNADRCLTVVGQCETLGDNCDMAANPGQEDLDQDGQGDACDPDDDNDGVCDPGEVDAEQCALVAGAADNCPRVANPDQANSDADSFGNACDADDDGDGVCDPGEQDGTQGCTLNDGQPDNCPQTVNGDQADADGDGIGDACESGVGAPEPGDLLINEVLADPSTESYGDANKDGTASSTQDEFVEFVNVSGGAVNLTGCSISDELGVKHEFAGGDPSIHNLENKQALVVFGGGTPAASTLLGGANVQVATGGTLSLNNSGDVVTLRCPGDDGSVTVATMTYDGRANADQSLTLSPQASVGAEYVQHTTLNSARHSAGTCPDGTPFSACLGD